MDYRAIVRQTAQDAGLDPNLAEAVLAQESGGNPNAVSPKGASGLMQLMPGTAKELGVDPSDPLQNIKGGVRYLKQQIDKYGTAGGIAAYNAGPGRFEKSGNDFNALPAETRNYVPAVMNRAYQLAQGNNMASDAEPKVIGLSDFMSAYDKAKEAKDDKAVSEIGMGLKQKFDEAYAKASAAKDQAAMDEIAAVRQKYVTPVQLPDINVGGKKEEPKRDNSLFVNPFSEEGKKRRDENLKTADNFVRGAADALTFGYSDEIAAGLDRLFGINTGKQGGAVPKNYDEALAAQRARDKEGGTARTVGQVAGSLVPVVKGVQAAEGATRLARAGAGAATGAVQGALYGSGSADGDLADRASGAVTGGAVGAALGGVLGGVMPATAVQKGNGFIKKAGSEEGAKIDAEIVKDLSSIANNPNMRGGKVQAVQMNNLEQSYVNDAMSAIKDLGKDELKKLGVKGSDLQSAIQARRIITPSELESLRTNPAGEALADAIEKAQRARALTAASPADNNLLVKGLRVAADYTLPGVVSKPINYMLNNRKSREEVVNQLLKNPDVAESVLQRLGPSGATQSLESLQGMAQKAQAAREAMLSQAQAAKAQKLVEMAQNKNSILNASKMPLGGGFQELLQGGKSGLNMTSDQAIDALRLVSQLDKADPKNKIIADAAKQILKSGGDIKDTNAFYGVQNTIRRLSEEGKIPGLNPGALSEVSSGIRNPVSYAANVKNAEEALKIARDNAPSKELAQFASQVGRIKSSADKAKAIESRIATATDAAEVKYLESLVKPLANFGKK